MYKYKAVAAVFFVLFLMFLQIKVFAADFSLPKVTIGPDKYLLFSVERLMENIVGFTKFTKQSKVDYYKELTLKRIAELKYVVDNKLLSEVERSSQRVSFEVGTLSDYISANKSELLKQSSEITNFLTGFQDLFANLRDKYPANSAYWLLIQHDINSININLQKLK